MESIYLKNILTSSQQPIVSLKELTPFGDAEISKDGTVKITGRGGVRTKKFITTEDVAVSLRLRSEKHITLRVAYIDSKGETHYDGTGEAVSSSVGDGLESIWKGFDAANLAVYRDAVDFFIELVCDGEAEFKVESGIVRGKSELERLSVYAEDLEGIVRNIDKKLAKIAYESASNTECIAESPSGKKFIVKVDDNGGISTAPTVPSKVLFMGNSLLLGMGYYGMCATSPCNDYFHIVSQAILEKNPNAVIERVHGARFEQLEDVEAFDKAWSEEPNAYTKRPACESFTEDLDLVIIQLVENVNSQNRRRVFAQNIEKLIMSIKKSSPKARILWFYGWWGDPSRDHIVEDACRRHRIACTSIADLYSKSTLGHMGQTYECADGSVKVAPELWLGHPGDEGMALIAHRMIDFIKM